MSAVQHGLPQSPLVPFAWSGRHGVLLMPRPPPTVLSLAWDRHSALNEVGLRQMTDQRNAPPAVEALSGLDRGLGWRHGKRPRLGAWTSVGACTPSQSQSCEAI